jgi:hypothetical protein
MIDLHDAGLSPRIIEDVGRAGARVRVGFPAWLSPFLRSWVMAVTIGRTIYLSRPVAGWPLEQIERTMRHELVHVRQAKALGLVRFLARYGLEYVSNRISGMDAHTAYLAISFECEARSAEEGFPGRTIPSEGASTSRQPDDI